VINLDRVAVDNPDVGRIDWFGKGWRCQEQRSDTGYEGASHRGLGFIFSSIHSAHFMLAR